MSAFGVLYPTHYAHRDEPAAALDVAFAITAARMSRGERVVDIGCGNGRHARALAATGLRVTGADRSPELLSAASAAGGGPSYVRADFRALPFRGVFDRATSFFTSFGYFDDAGNAAQLQSVRRSLRAGGTLFMDFLNAPHVAATMIPESERAAGTLRATEQRVIRQGRVEKSVELFDGDRRVAAWRESVRLYDRGALEAMLAAADLRPLAA